MPSPARYVIVYLWQGERHRANVYDSFDRAAADLRDFRAAKWNAWIETL